MPRFPIREVDPLIDIWDRLRMDEILREHERFAPASEELWRTDPDLWWEIFRKIRGKGRIGPEGYRSPVAQALRTR